MTLFQTLTVATLVFLAACGSRPQPVASGYGTSAQSCLAEAMYFEARGTGEAGRRAVGEVILNRTNNPPIPVNRLRRRGSALQRVLPVFLPLHRSVNLQRTTGPCACKHHCKQVVNQSRRGHHQRRVILPCTHRITGVVRNVNTAGNLRRQHLLPIVNVINPGLTLDP